MKTFFLAQRTIFPALFRVSIGVILLFDLAMTFGSSALIYGTEFNSFYSQNPIFLFIARHVDGFYAFYALVLLFFILGIGKNLTSFLVFVFYLFQYKMTEAITTWGDLVLLVSLLFFVFVDSFRYLSISKNVAQSGYVSKLAVISILLNLFLIYLDNAFYKSIGHHWQEGVAVFYSFAQYDNFKESWVYPIIANSFLSSGINYLVILLQLVFTPLVIWRKTRYFVLLVSALIHLIMMFQFGLWKFELIILLLYGFVLSDEEWRKLLPESIQIKYFQNEFNKE